MLYFDKIQILCYFVLLLSVQLNQSLRIVVITVD